ncbi:hypothetical protein EC968_007027 [Mortierella alpina]|nr:hypothetical protein EC968_007027 [Mortierella alpina]
MRTISHCRNAAAMKRILMAAIVLNAAASLCALSVLIYRKRGLRHTIITDLFTKVGTGIQPKPLYSAQAVPSPQGFFMIKQARILQANIMSAETELKIDMKKFGLQNLVSKSPARFLHIMMLLTGLLGGIILLVAGILCM